MLICFRLHKSAQQVVRAAIDEDVDCIGVSFLSGQHMAQMRMLFDAMSAEGLECPVVCGGVIPDDDADELRELGTAEVIRPGTLTSDLLELVNRAIASAPATTD